MVSQPARKTLMGACLGDCVHVAGIRVFLGMAEDEGYTTLFAGAAQRVEDIVTRADEWKPDLLALSYRLNSVALSNILEELGCLLAAKGLTGIRMVFGGTDENCRVAGTSGLFEATFGSSTSQSTVQAYLRGERAEVKREALPDTLVDRIHACKPFPLLRHHFGRPTVDETVRGAREIAEASVIDVLSLGPDQNAQESFFRPEDMDHAQDGAGGVPFRSETDLRAIYEATRAGNRPLVRCYSGTRDLVRMADMLTQTIHNAWAAIPLFWYSELDRRSPRALRDAIREGQEAIRWHAERGIPVEVNESHQWSLRQAPDVVAVVAFFLAAYNAKALGVRDYIGQFMFNTPVGTSPTMDIAKMQAKLELVRELEDDQFKVWRQTRTGLASMPAGQEEAIGHMCASVAVQMHLEPHIVHVVGFSEADHATTAEELIASARIARGAIRSLVAGTGDITHDPAVRRRREQLVSEARTLLSALTELTGCDHVDPWQDVETLARAVERGLLDAPDLAGNPPAKGAVKTRLLGGACVAVDDDGRPKPEADRVRECLSQVAGNCR